MADDERIQSTDDATLELWRSLTKRHIEQGLYDMMKCVKCGFSESCQISGTPLLMPHIDVATGEPISGLVFVSKSCHRCGHTEFYSLSATELLKEVNRNGSE